MAYITTTSYKDILYNLVYKTGQMLDELRIIYFLIYQNGPIGDKQIYVISRSAGTLINIILDP